LRQPATIFPTLLQGVIRSKASLAGSIMFVVLFPVLLVVVLIDLAGGVENPYYGLLLYLTLVPLLLIALLLMAVGLWRGRAHAADPHLYSYEFFKEQLLVPERYQRLRRLFRFAVSLAAVFFFALGVAAHTGYHYANSMEFCGVLCHAVMEPAYITHQNSPHSRVRCVVCHNGLDGVGEHSSRWAGIRHFVATINGVAGTSVNTPIHSLQPSRKTCEECHQPDKFHGHKLYFRDTFLPDEESSPMRIAMIIKVGSGGDSARVAQGIHWHISPNHQLSYLSTDPAGNRVVRVRLVAPDGQETVYFKEGVTHPVNGYEKQLNDCLDCHVRPTHVLLSSEAAIDQKILIGLIPRNLPFSKRQALAAITGDYRDSAAARQGIASRLQEWYAEHYPELIAIRPDLLARAIAGAQQAYAENVFPERRRGWVNIERSHPDFGCNPDQAGCFRCHDGSLKSADGGKVISRACDTCHVVLTQYQPLIEGGGAAIESEGKRP